MPPGSAEPRAAAPPGPRSSGGRWIWPAAAAVALAGAGISGYLTITALAGAPPVCLAGDCAAVAASPYAKLLGVPTAAWGLAAYLVVGALSLWLAWGSAEAWLPLVVLGLTVFGVTFSLYLLWIQIAVLKAVCSWCAASDVLWVVLLALSLTAVLRAD